MSGEHSGPANPLRRRPYAVKAARTVTTGGMKKRVVRYRALSLPTQHGVELAWTGGLFPGRDHARRSSHETYRGHASTACILEAAHLTTVFQEGC
jgi:hypothetical protein